MAKHFELAIGEQSFSFARKQDAIAAEAALDGIYIIRTSVPQAQMNAADCVRNYKALANVERAFRSLKTVDLKVRPIHHRTADRVRAPQMNSRCVKSRSPTRFWSPRCSIIGGSARTTSRSCTRVAGTSNSTCATSRPPQAWMS